MRVIFMGTPAFAVPTLRALVGSPHDVVAVYCQPPRPAGRGQKVQPSAVQQLAEAHALPVHYPTSLKSSGAQAEFASFGADVVVVAAYGLLLPQAILDACTLGCLNVHPSDLPRWRGAAPLQHTVWAGDTATAMCIMQMDAGLDTGAVRWRQPVTLQPNITAGALHDQMAILGAEGVLAVLADMNAYPAIPQQGESVYAPKITKESARIDWMQPASAIERQIRAMNPYPAAWAILGGELVKIFAGAVEARLHNKAPGTLLDDALLVACGENALRLTEIQRPGKKRMSAADALRGWQEVSQTAE